jgi:hypothetical protein
VDVSLLEQFDMGEGLNLKMPNTVHNALESRGEDAERAD